MIHLVDTNVLLRYADRTDPRFPTARRAVNRLRHEHQLRTAPQNLVEFWNVMTRPADRNGFGKTTSEAEPLLELTEQLFPRLADPLDTYDRWRELVIRFRVSGVQVHDARLVAIMLGNEVSRILTFNANDFDRYIEIGIQAVDPENI